jgi:hypothetical protein
LKFGAGRDVGSTIFDFTPDTASECHEERRISVLRIRSVPFDERLLVFGNVVDREDRIRCTGGNARAAVDALRRVNKELSRFFDTSIPRLVPCGSQPPNPFFGCVDADTVLIESHPACLIDNR